MSKYIRVMNTRDLIIEESELVTKLLLMKNEAYGDSALNPSNIFANGDAVENLSARIDDKLMRIKMRGINDETEDTVQDLIGYLILLKVALRVKHG
tara:strand:+ start:5182 stop:5469 length:288 start_codon:yes stop_codon:yes gene_type:complete